MKGQWTIWGGKPHELVGGRWKPRTIGEYMEALLNEERARKPPLWLYVVMFFFGFISAVLL